LTLTSNRTSHGPYIQAASRRAIRYLLTPTAFRRSVASVLEAGGTVQVLYETALSTGAVYLSREPIAVLPSTNWRPLIRRRQLMLAAGLLLFVLGMAYAGAYAGRHEWFAKYGRTSVVVLMVLSGGLMPLLAAAVVGHFALPIGARGRHRPPIWLAVIAAGCAVTAIAAAAGQPSAEDASRALQAGDVARGYLTAVAVHDLGLRSATTAATIADDAHLQLVRSASSVASLVGLVRQRWYEPPRQKEATDILRQTAERDGWAAFHQRNAAGVASIAGSIQGLVPDSAALLSALAASLRADQCRSSHNYTCAAEEAKRAATLAPSVTEVSEAYASTRDALAAHHRAALDGVRTAKKLQDRHNALTAAIAAAKAYEVVASPAPGTASRDLTQQLANVDAAIAQGEQRQRQQAAQAEQRQRQREEARQRQRMETWSMAPLRCRDGTLSPSCICGGSRRGCCSHHGGVAGCSADH